MSQIGPVQIELDKAGRFVEINVSREHHARAQVELLAVSAWGGAVLGFMGSAALADAPFYEIDVAYRMSAEGLSVKMDVAGIARLRLQVLTASSTAGALGNVNLFAQEA